MRREFASIIIGIGFTIVSVILPYWIPSMSSWIIYSGLSVGAFFIDLGFSMFFWKPKKQEVQTSVSSSTEQDNAPKNYGISSLNQSGGFTGNNMGHLHQGDVYYQERDNAPAELYVPNPKELKNKIKIETLNLQRELKTFSYLSGENGRKQFEVVLEIAVNIWKNLLNPAKAIFSDTQIPVLIDEIYTQITRFKMNWETLKYEYDEKNNWLRVAKSNHPEIIVINKKIANLETELDQLINSIEAKINWLIDLTKN